MATKIYESFLGGGDGYTKAQRTGLRRSAEIKKRRKEEERAFEKTQESEKGRRALTERSMIEAGQTRRTGMGVAGGIEQQRMSDVGQMARQRLTGGQEARAATVKSIREANVATMKHGREMTLAETKGPTDYMQMEDITGKEFAFSPSTGRSRYPQSPGGGAGGGLEGDQKEYTFAQFTDLDQGEQKKYMAYMYSKDKEKYLDFARQWGLLANPKKELQEEELAGVSGADIRRSLGGTYTNF